MSPDQTDMSPRSNFYQLAGFTGFGWTMSMLVFLTTVVNSGDGPIGRRVADPQVLLYLGGVLLLMTVVLNRFTAPSD